MKKALFLVILGVLAIGVIQMLNGFIKSKNTYCKSAEIISVDNHEVECVDLSGNIWVFEDENEWEIGDVISFEMYNNKTDEIYDDEILTNTIVYQGNISE